MQKPTWMNNTVLGASLTSFFSDLSHEAVTVLLPSLLILLGAPIAILGVIEGVSDGASSFVKLASGYLADRCGNKKAMALLGYLATAIFPAFVAIASSWPIVLGGRAFGWIGRGLRGPPRDAILSGSVEENDLGKAFGFHRAGDTLGAIAGPLIALSLLTTFGIRDIIWLTVIPGFLAVISFWLLVHDDEKTTRKNHEPFVVSMKNLPSRFRSFLVAIFLFGIGDFSHTLLIAFVVAIFTPSLGLVAATAVGASMYLIRNGAYAIGCYPFGALGDRFGRRNILVLGYVLAGVTFLGFMTVSVSIPAIAGLFICAGLYIAAEDTLEGAVTGEIVEKSRQGMAYGTLAAVNGVGDLISSVGIGIIWSYLGYQIGFAIAACFAFAGALTLLVSTRRSIG